MEICFPYYPFSNYLIAAIHPITLLEPFYSLGFAGETRNTQTSPLVSGCWDVDKLLNLGVGTIIPRERLTLAHVPDALW